METKNNDEFRPRSRLISVGANTAIIGLLLTAFALWHNSQMDVLKLSYENRILAIQSEIKGLEKSGRLNAEGSKRMITLLHELVDSRTNQNLMQTIIVVIIGVCTFLGFTTLIASIVVTRNRTVVKAAYKKGFRDGAESGKEDLVLHGAEEFMTNYVQKGGE
jgi:hypothetical protein